MYLLNYLPRPLSAILALLLSCGCAPGLRLPATPVAPETLLSYAPLLSPTAAAKATADWLEPDAEMRQITAGKQGNHLSIQDFRNLLFRLHDPSLGPMRYRPDATLTASEAYQQRRANCLSYSAMVVSLARDIGLKAHFQRVYLAPQWSLRGNTSIAGLHINAKVTDRYGRTMLVDWGWQATGETLRVRRISDTEARAEFHNNIGTATLLDNALIESYADLREALILAPETSHIWVNLGALLRRTGDLAAAESAWLEALRLDPGNVYAMSGLLRLYRSQNRVTLAAQLQDELHSFHTNNPYYHYLLAKDALNRGDRDAAYAAIRDAQSLKDDPLFDEFVARIADNVESTEEVISNAL